MKVEEVELSLLLQMLTKKTKKKTISLQNGAEHKQKCTFTKYVWAAVSIEQSKEYPIFSLL